MNTSSLSVKNPSTNLAFEEFFERQEKSSLSNSETNQIKKSGKWTAEEDDQLNKYVPIYGEKQWRKIADHVPGRSSIQCLHRWTKILKPGLVKGPWTQEEDQKLNAWVRAEGPTKWAQAAAFIKGRSGKQCRERWFNNLCPGVKKGSWSEEEDEMIFQLYQKYGSSWSKIAKYIPGRTENAIKNRFYSTLRKVAADKKKTFLENSSNDIKRELSDGFSDNEKEESKTALQKVEQMMEDQLERKNSKMTVEAALVAEKIQLLEQSMGEKDLTHGLKTESRQNSSVLDDSQNTLLKRIPRDPQQTEQSKEKDTLQGEPKIFSAVPSKLPDEDKKVDGFVEAVARQLSSVRVKKSDAEFENYLKEIDQEDSVKRLMAKKMLTQDSQPVRQDEDNNNRTTKPQKEYNAFPKNNTKEVGENFHPVSNLGLEFENSMGSSLHNYSSHQEGSEKNFRSQRKNIDAGILRPEVSNKGFRVHNKNPNTSYPNLNEPRPKLMAESSRDHRYENSLSVSRRDSLSEIGNEMPRKKESVWVDSRNAFGSKGFKQVRPSHPEEYEQSYQKGYQIKRESSGFEDPQNRNNASFERQKNFSRSQHVYNQRVTYDTRDAMEEEDQDSTDDIQMTLADELLSSLKFHRGNQRGMVRNINPVVKRESVSSSIKVPCDDKISSLFQQINSLESLLSTTRNELNKLDNNEMQQDTYDEHHSLMDERDFSHSVPRRSILRREEDAYNEYIPMKRR